MEGEEHFLSTQKPVKEVWKGELPVHLCCSREMFMNQGPVSYPTPLLLSQPAVRAWPFLHSSVSE